LQRSRKRIEDQRRINEVSKLSKLISRYHTIRANARRKGARYSAIDRFSVVSSFRIRRDRPRYARRVKVKRVWLLSFSPRLFLGIVSFGDTDRCRSFVGSEAKRSEAKRSENDGRDTRRMSEISMKSALRARSDPPWRYPLYAPTKVSFVPLLFRRNNLIPDSRHASREPIRVVRVPSHPESGFPCVCTETAETGLPKRNERETRTPWELRIPRRKKCIDSNSPVRRTDSSTILHRFFSGDPLRIGYQRISKEDSSARKSDSSSEQRSKRRSLI